MNDFSNAKPAHRKPRNRIQGLASLAIWAGGMLMAGAFFAPPAVAQRVCLPLPRLLSTMPMGGQAGTEVEITITCENVEDAAELFFSHPGIVATPLVDEAGQPIPNRYLVSIAADCPPGLYETRVMSRLGLSSTRIFSVGSLQELTQTTPNTSLATAMELPVDAICNAVMSTRSVDHYVFDASQGQRYVVNCSARGIDSKLDAVLIVADEQGRDLVVERRGGSIDFKAPADGRYVIKVHELTFQGGPGFFYRLSLQNLPADAAEPVFASTRNVSAFSWPAANLPPQATSFEVEPNNLHADSQKVDLPCDILGSFATAADVDTYEFMATKGDVWWVEVASERLGRPTDPSILVQHVKTEGGQEVLTDVAEFSDIPSPMKPSSNAYAYDGPPYDGGSPDILGKLEIKEDGLHRLQILDLFGGTRTDPRNVYRLIIRKAAPDFALAAWGLHMELRNGDRSAFSKPIALRGGSTIALEVVAFRRDGFAGEIDLKIDNLPDGVTAHGIKIAAGASRGIMLITADQDAPRGLAFANFVGQSEIDGQAVTRPVQMAALAWPVVDAWSEIPSPRLESGVPVSVGGSELAPVTIRPVGATTIEAVEGTKMSIPLAHLNRSEFSGSIVQMKAFGSGFERMPQFDLTLTEPTSQAVIDLAALKIPAGDHVVSFYGGAVAKYQYNPDAVHFTQSEHDRAVEAAKQSADELQRLMAQADTAAETLEAAKMQSQAAEAAVTAAAAKVASATATAAPQDTVDIVVTEPITIRVLPAESK
jgi:hypothetical protein